MQRTAVVHAAPPDRADDLVDRVPGLLRYARTLVSDTDLAEDLVQDTLVRAMEQRDSFRGQASLATWLHRILHNLAVDRTRRRHETPSELSDRDVEAVASLWHDDAYTIDSAVVVERAHVRDQLRDALLRLPLIYRSAVVLHDAEGLTAGQVAEVQQISLAAAKQRLRRGRMLLVSELTRATTRHTPTEVPMRCWDARSRVSDYIDAELSARERAMLEQHLEKCPTCPPLYAGLVGVQEALGSRRDPDEVVPAQLAQRIRSILTP